MAQSHYRSGVRTRARWLVGGTVLACIAGAQWVTLLGAPSRADAAEASPARPSDLDTANCTACHALREGFSHPVDITPSMRTPASLPLKDGRVTCDTCHDGVAARGHSARAPQGKSYLRWAGEVGSLCSSCHDGSRQSPHGTGTLRAHLVASDSRPTRARMDDESRACLGCHDGVTASDAGAHPAMRTAEFGSGDAGFSSDHPIGAAMDGHKLFEGGTLKAVAGVDRRVRLFGRTVGCGSCHSVYSTIDANLVMSNRGSALCLSCHEL